MLLSPVFFFQAEDGIRDLTVTGVQTCALPIWRAGLAYLLDTSQPIPVGTPPPAIRAGDGAETQIISLSVSVSRSVPLVRRDPLGVANALAASIFSFFVIGGKDETCRASPGGAGTAR